MQIYLILAAHHACTDGQYWGTSDACQWHLARVDAHKAGVTGWLIAGLLAVFIIGTLRSISRRS